MDKYRQVLRKFFSIFALFSLLLQTLSPFAYIAPSAAFAQEVTPTESPVPTPADTPSIAPTPDATVAPTEVTPTPADTVTPTDSPTPVPEPSVTVTPAPSDNPTPSDSQPPNNNSPPAQDQNANAPTATPSVTVTPTESPSNPTQNGEIQATILKNVAAPTLDLSVSTVEGSATLTTNKADYSPTDTVVITGSNLLPKTSYTLYIESSNPPPVNFSTQVTANDNGIFVYSYQLDGNYRPNYSVELKDASGNVVASTTFTDSPVPSSVNLLDWKTKPSGGWINGNLGSSNTDYAEGETVPFELDLGKLNTSGNPYTFSVCRDYQNGTKRGYISLQPYNTSRPAVPDGAISTNNGPFSGSNISSISFTEIGGQGGCNSGQRETQVSFSVTSGSVNTYLLWGGKLASPLDAGAGNGAASYPGSSLSMQLLSPAKNASINPNAIIELAQITVTKTVDSGSATADEWCFNISPNPNGETLPKCPATGQNSVTFLGLATGSYQVTETNNVTGYAFSSGNGTSCTFNGSTGTASVTSATTATNATCNFHNAQQKGSLTVIKHVSGGTATANQWTMHINQGVNNDVVPSFPGAESPGTTTSNLTANTYTVTESGGPTGYTLSYSGSCDSNGNVTVAAGQTATCTLTNTRDTGTLKVIKNVINDNGGTKQASDFTLHVKSSGTDVTNSPQAGSSTGTIYTLPVGSYSVSENTPPAGYTQTGFSGTCDSQGNVSVTKNTQSTCTITNNDVAPSLTLNKVVQNNNGGTAKNTDWTLTATGTGGSPTNLSGTTPVTSGITFKADTYTLAESGPSGYSASNWVCTGTGSQNGSQVTLGVGQSETCTITNSDVAPTLKLVKNVVNDNGGTKAPHDWTLTATGTGGFSDTGDSTTFHTVKAGVAYTLSESTISGYSAGNWSCDGGSLSTNQLTLSLNQNVTCTITNNDIQPKLTVTKVVNNEAGSTGQISDFPLFVGQTSVTSGNQNGFNAGAYIVSETNQTGWTEVISGDCNPTTGSVTLGAGDVKSCTITNTRDTGTVQVKKIVVPSDSSQWDMTISGSTPNNGTIGDGGQTSAFVSATGSYTVSESGHTGTNTNDYTTTYSCTDANGTVTSGSTTSAQFSLTKGENVVCTFTNTRKQGRITFEKVVDDNSDVSGWTFSVNGKTYHSGDSDSFDTGTYTVTESGSSDYTPFSVSGVCSGLTGSDATLTVTENGGTCTFTNHVKRGTMIVKKVMVSATGSFTFTGDVAGTISSNNGTITVNNVLPGSYTSSESAATGWDLTGISCDDNNSTGDTGTRTATFNVDAGETVTCTFTNTAQNARITIHKNVINPDGGEVSDSHSFTVQRDGADDKTIAEGTDATYSVAPGTYVFTENPGGDYTLDSITGDNDADPASGATVTVGPGGTASLTFVNKQKKATITVEKNVLDANGDHTTDTTTFTSQLNGANDDSTLSETNNVVYLVNPGGPYSITETGVDTSKYTPLGCKVGELNADNITLGSNGSTTVTCTNQQVGGTISGHKYQADGITPIQNWGISLFTCNSNFLSCTLSATNSTDINGFYSFTPLLTGFYQVVEDLISTFTPIGATYHNVTINPGTVSDTGNDFANFKNIDITVCKKSDTDGNLETTNDEAFVKGWGMTLYSDNEQVGDSQTTNSDGCVVFSNLGPNHDYKVTEETRTGWTPLNDTTHDFGLPQDGVDQNYTFINYGHGSITVHKKVDANGEGNYTNADDGDFTWTLDGTGEKVMGSTDSNVTVKDHSVGENSPDNYHFVSWYATGGYDQHEKAYSCSNPTGTTLPITVNVGPGGTSNFTICNARDTGTITVNKVVDPSEDNGLFNLQIDENTKASDVGDGGTTDGITVLSGTHSVGETAGEGTSLSSYSSSISCVSDGGEGEEIASTDGNGTSLSGIQVNNGDNIVCTITNTRKGKVIVTKYNDLNGNGKLDENEGVLSGWTINLGEDSKVTDENGQAVFDNLLPDYYTLNEDLNSKPGWEQTGISCDQRAFVEGEVRVNAGDVINCRILNKSITPILTITKENNTGGATLEPGAEVLYTITVSLSEDGGAAKDVKVTDLLPDGFKYTHGSWTASLNGSPISIPEPTYASPGVWSVGDMNSGDKVTLTYKAIISNDQQLGTYKDVAWAQGTPVSGGDPVFAIANNPGDLDISDPASNFVGTDVTISKLTTESVGLSVQKGEILGASTEELPGTGANTFWTMLSVLALIYGLNLILLGIIIRRKYA